MTRAVVGGAAHRRSHCAEPQAAEGSRKRRKADRRTRRQPVIDRNPQLGSGASPAGPGAPAGNGSGLLLIVANWPARSSLTRWGTRSKRIEVTRPTPPIIFPRADQPRAPAQSAQV